MWICELPKNKFMRSHPHTAKLSAAALTATLLVSIAGQAQAITFEGTSSGQWGMPANPSGSTVISNQNGGINNRLSWGRTDNCLTCTPFNNYVQYDGVSFNAGVGSIFNLGNLTYRNGSTWDGFNGDFPLNIALSLTNPFSSTKAFDFSFNIFNTPNNSGDAVVDGDKLRFSTAGISSQQFNYDGVDYTLELTGFSSDGGQTIMSEFNSPEASIANASLYGKLTGVVQAPPEKTIPEPAAVAGLSLLGIYFATRRRSRNI
ncbi:choice-of-anchor K domain-containing protein [Argonema antarcticum A004/B2]|nr:choice-of-anchor K domain-containing protein [Argonema antarcticum A004/B2]